MRPPDRLARALVDAAFELHRLRLWLQVPADVPIQVRVPGEPHPLLVTVLGHLGNDYGVFVMRGEHAMDRYRRFLESPDGSMDELDLLAMTMDPLGQIPPEMRGVLHAAGVSARRETLIPRFFAKPPGFDGVRMPTRGEQRLLLSVMRGLGIVHAAGELHVEPLDRHAARLLEITIEGEGRELRASTRTLRWGARALEPTIPVLDVAAGDPSAKLSWIAGAIDGRELGGADLKSTRLIVVAEEGEDVVVGQRVVPSNSAAHALALFTELTEEDPDGPGFGDPEQVSFADRDLFKDVAPALERVGVRCRWIENAGERKAALARLRALAVPIQDVDREDLDEDQLPTDMFGWKAADIRITRRLCALEHGMPASLPRAMKRYFGSEAIGVEVLQELQGLMPMQSFLEWRIVDERPTVRSKTFLEKRLKDRKLSRLERTVIESKLAARISIYRVVSLRAGESIELEDTLDGTRFTVQERSLSGCDIEGCFLPLRISTLGGWHFITMAGPPINPLLISRVMEALEASGVEFSAEGLKRHPEVLGQLWQFLLPRNLPAPKLCNTDGDPLLWHTATFRLGDVATAAAALTLAPNVRLDERGTWTWWREAAPAAGIGDNVVLGTLEIFDDRLVLEVNSTARFQRARAWIELLPGVAFERVTTHELTSGQAPMDDRLPSKQSQPDPKQEAMLREACAQAARKTLDQPNPEFGGLTPRQAWARPEKRKQVERWVRTMPAMLAEGGLIEPPREALLRELGRGMRG